MTIAIDDVFIAPIPTTMKVNGFFRTGSISNLSEEARNEVERRLGNNARGWTAVAIGETGRPGVIVGAPSERVAIGSALADCGRKDRACRVIAIGPFSVEPLGR
jgi:adenylate cyclase